MPHIQILQVDIQIIRFLENVEIFWSLSDERVECWNFTLYTMSQKCQIKKNINFRITFNSDLMFSKIFKVRNFVGGDL